MSTRAKLTKQLAGYREAEEPGISCDTCHYMVADGSCEAVQGMVEPEDVCDLWTGDAD